MVAVVDDMKVQVTEDTSNFEAKLRDNQGENVFNLILDELEERQG